MIDEYKKIWLAIAVILILVIFGYYLCNEEKFVNSLSMSDIENSETKTYVKKLLDKHVTIVSNYDIYKIIEETKTENNTFPKVFHFIWYQGIENIPYNRYFYLFSYIFNNPDFKFYLWDQKSMENLADIQITEYKDKYYSMDSMIKKIDVIRPMILLYMGGIYSDLDTICLNNLVSVLDNEEAKKYNIILSYEFFGSMPNTTPLMQKELLDNFGKDDIIPLFSSYGYITINNSFLISKPGNQYWKDILDNSQNRNNVMISAGPVVHSYTYYKGKQEDRYHDIYLMTEDMFDGGSLREDKFILHHHACEWCGGDDNGNWFV